MYQDIEKHEMMLKAVFLSGAQEWSCPICGRRFVIQFTPEYKRVVLEPGEEYITHTVSAEGIQLSLAQASENETAQAESQLALWVEALADINFKNL